MLPWFSLYIRGFSSFFGISHFTSFMSFFLYIHNFSKNPGIFTPSRWIFSRIDSHIVINIPKFTLSLTSISTNAPKFLINSLLCSYKFHFLFSSFDLFYMQMSFSFLMCTFIEEERKPVNDKLQHNNGKPITIVWQAPHWYQGLYCYRFHYFHSTWTIAAVSAFTNLQALWCFIWRRIDPDFRYCGFFRPKKTCNCPILPLIQIHLRNHKKLSSIPDDFLCMKCFFFRKCEYRDRRSISDADHHSGGMKPHASYRHPHILYLLI